MNNRRIKVAFIKVQIHHDMDLNVGCGLSAFLATRVLLS